MAHAAQREFFDEITRRFASNIKESETILEIGAQNINGSIRSYFPAEVKYLGIDIGDGKDVDVVMPGELIQLPDGWADISVSSECFEHAVAWHEVFMNMIRCTRSNGLVFVTCAGFGRPTHGTIDSDIGSSPFTNNYYLNLDPIDIAQSVKIGKYFQKHGFEVNSSNGDTFFWGIRSDNTGDLEVMELEDALARARGQIGKMAETIAQQSSEIKYLRAWIGKKLLLKMGRGVMAWVSGVQRFMRESLT